MQKYMAEKFQNQIAVFPTTSAERRFKYEEGESKSTKYIF
jgi:hypothetical protein